MRHDIAVGVPTWPTPAGGWTLWVPVIALLAFAVSRRFFTATPLRTAVPLAIAVGFVAAWMVDRWGVAPTSACVLPVLVGLAAARRRKRPPSV